MGWTDAVREIVSRYSGAGGGAAAAPEDPHQDFCDIAESAPKQVMADGLSQAFRSDQTPSFPEMVSTLFRQSNPTQKAGLLSQLLAAAGPAALASVPGLRSLADSASSGQGVTPEAANKVSADQVQQIAGHAERSTPSIIDQVSGFYAQHPDVVKALGGAAITIAIQHMIRPK